MFPCFLIFEGFLGVPICLYTETHFRGLWLGSVLA